VRVPRGENKAPRREGQAAPGRGWLTIPGGDLHCGDRVHRPQRPSGKCINPYLDLNLDIFGRSKSGVGKTGEGGPSRDPRKARRFFEHAEAVADARNYDYAIQCYIDGLRHEPDNLAKHEALRDVALRRKVSGGKPAGLKEKLTGGGSGPIDKMLHAERLWSMDPLNAKHARDMMKHAVDADADENLNMAEVAYWCGGLALDMNAQAKKPDKAVYLSARDLFVKIEAYDKAVDACRRALQMDPGNSTLITELKNLDAERTMRESYAAGDKSEEGGFRKFIKDADKQKALEQDDALSARGDTLEQIINRRRAEYEEDPQDLDKLQKLVDALLRKETNESEKEAIELLRKAWEETGQYRYKVRVGDVQMKQITRYLRQLRAKVHERPDDADLKKKYEDTLRKRLAFELQEFTERVKNYPTDMALRFELGKRLHQAGKLDEAIGAFQQTKADPKHRAASHMYLGSCYLAKQWYDEAIDTIRSGIEGHGSDDDRRALERRYLLMDALEKNARKNRDAAQAKEAQKTASTILQTDINYRDIRERMNTIRALVDELAASAGSA